MTFQIIVPGRFIEPKDPVSMRFSQKGFFTLSAVKNGRVVRKVTFEDGSTRPIPNLILNQGLDYFGDNPGFSDAIKVGTGTTPPSPTDTELHSPLPGFISTSRSGSGAGTPPDYVAYCIFSGRSEIGQFGNANLTEIRFGTSTDGQATSRALILDSSGNPAAFPIQEDEQLDASYEIRLVPPLTDTAFDVNVSGPRSCVVRALNVNAESSGWSVREAFSQNATRGQAGASGMFTGGLNAIDQVNPMGSRVTGEPTVTVQPYSSGSYKRVNRFSWGSGGANNASMSTHRVDFGCCAFQVSYDPPLSKTNQQSMYLDYGLEWGRA